MHQSLPRTIDYVEMPSCNLADTKRFFSDSSAAFEDYGPDYAAFDDGRMAGGFFSAKETWSSATVCPLVVFYAENLKEMRGEVLRLGGTVTREIFAFPGGRRFHFQAPGTGELAFWSEK